jgi:hypothetical protein
VTNLFLELSRNQEQECLQVRFSFHSFYVDNTLLYFMGFSLWKKTCLSLSEPFTIHMCLMFVTSCNQFGRELFDDW